MAEVKAQPERDFSSPCFVAGIAWIFVNMILFEYVRLRASTTTALITVYTNSLLMTPAALVILLILGKKESAEERSASNFVAVALTLGYILFPASALLPFGKVLEVVGLVSFLAGIFVALVSIATPQQK